MIELIGAYSIPVIITGTALAILISNKSLFNEFTIGCREGLITSIKLLPTLIILICSVKMFASSTALEIICDTLGNISESIGIPNEIIPIIITRPISGSAATAMMDNLYSKCGVDSFPATAASVLMGSTDTLIYTLSMYFSATGIKKTGYSLPASFILYGFAVIASVAVSSFFAF